MPIVNARVARCSSDLKPGVLCCSWCGKCGEHLHAHATKGMSTPLVAQCAGCGNTGVLCCSACGNCGEHLHSWCPQAPP